MNPPGLRDDLIKLAIGRIRINPGLSHLSDHGHLCEFASSTKIVTCGLRTNPPSSSRFWINV